MRFKLDPKDDATKQACTHVFSLLCNSIGTTFENLTLKARLTMKSPKHLQWNILQMKTGQPSLNTGLIQSIRGKPVRTKEPEPNAVQIFKDCHTSKMKGMSTAVQAAVEAMEQMIELPQPPESDEATTGTMSPLA